VEEVPYPKAPRRLPIIPTYEEAVRLIDSASNLFHRAMLMTVYSTGMRRAEMGIFQGGGCRPCVVYPQLLYRQVFSASSRRRWRHPAL
jgi:hypothetical protein